MHLRIYAARMRTAEKRVRTCAAALATRLGISNELPPPDSPQGKTDNAVRRLQELESVAGLLENVLDALEKVAPPPQEKKPEKKAKE